MRYEHSKHKRVVFCKTKSKPKASNAEWVSQSVFPSKSAGSKASKCAKFFLPFILRRDDRIVKSRPEIISS